MNENTNKTAGEKIETLARVTDTGTMLARNMGWETSYVRFTLMADDGTFTGASVVWHSENASKAANDLKAGMDVALSGFRYGNKMRRVQVAKGCLVWGIGQ